LGVKQESLFVWVHCWDNKKGLGWRLFQSDEDDTVNIKVTAYTVAELGSMLGQTTSENILRAYGEVFNVPDTRVVTPEGIQLCMAKPDIGAQMLIYLLENNLITI
jgi:hypothetical protein